MRLWEEFEEGDSDAYYGDDDAGESDHYAKFCGFYLGFEIRNVMFGCEVFEVCRSDDIAINRFAESFDDGLGLRFVEACVLQFFDDSVGVESDGCHVVERLSQGVRSILIYVHGGVCASRPRRTSGFLPAQE